ncbi:translocation/assembly module TamB domain-containing protein [Flavisphingomonas formosensis]|uniref:translocation/assembly module TamB domain-containing protein n=1 Tax=Flavisphingomonas formosensis TaxID=861534 RepID=UPI0012F8B370|nr:translocation/assembly module TamB domain-containing protein [Sphingomonas formosensis]
MEQQPVAEPSRRTRWFSWILRLLAALAVMFVFVLWAIDTNPGHRFLADRIAEYKPSSGLRIRVGRIDGSIWSRAQLRDLRLYDTRGLFLEVPSIELDWRPTAWIANRLHINRLSADLAMLDHLPRLHETDSKGPILPGFDIHVGALHVARLRLGKAVAGEVRVATLDARADIRHGRALIDLKAGVSGSRDRLALLLDAEPDRGRFDLEASLHALARGAIGAMLGTERPIEARITGDGNWAQWKGSARVDVSGLRIVDLGLGVHQGRYSLGGVLTPAPITSGKKARLTAPRVVVKGEATLAGRRLDGTLALRSAAVALTAKGVIDLAENGFDPVTVDGQLLKPEALFPNMSGSGIKLHATFRGPFQTAAFDYLLSAPRFAFDQTGFEDARASGKGHLSAPPVSLPIRFVARRVTGVGSVAGGILGNLTVDGVLKVTGKTLSGEGLSLSSDKLKGKLALLVDLVGGDYTVTLSGQLTRYFIPGLGIVDVMTDLKVVPGAGGHGSQVVGRGRAWVRRFDNVFLRSLAGGLPQLETALVRGPDQMLFFNGLKLTAPAIRITGKGQRRRDGSFAFKGSGEQSQYGPFDIVLDGNISRPKIDLVLAHPVDALGLSAVKLGLDPTPQGFAWRASGQSALGPFTGNGQILLPSGQPATIEVATLDVSGTRASGSLRSDPGGFTGQLAVLGGGVDGRLLFSPQREIQRIEGHLTARNARFEGTQLISVQRGALDGVVLLDPAGISVDATATAQNLRRGQFSVARLAGNVSLRAGHGTVKASLAGSRGRSFELQLLGTVDPGRVSLTGQGTIDRKPIKLTTPAVFTREETSWRLGSTSLQFAGGSATLSGLFGGTANQVDAQLDRMPLSVLDIGWPALGLGGYASGKFSYSLPKGSALPAGRADLVIRGLTRSGLVVSSKPIDVGVAAVLQGNAAAARAVMASGGQTIGRAQFRLAPLLDGGDLGTRLFGAPLFGQMRYQGPADTLWRLTGIETIDLSGPIAIGADMSGTLGDPRIRGSVRTMGARLESGVTGTVITGLNASGSFDGSKLVIPRFDGTTPKGGVVSGQASFDLAARNGFGMDVTLQANRAVLLNRDDIGATVTGPLHISSDGSGGLISGAVTLDKGLYRLGRAAAAQVPQLTVEEVNRDVDEAGEAMRARKPWALDITAKARNQLAVTGLGLDSEWRADLAIKGRVDNPAISGRADLVRGGYQFAGRRFDLQRGAIRFTGAAPPDPVLDIVAQANVQSVNATIQVTGTGLHPEISFTSIPALPEDELLSRLLFGTSITNLSAPEALQLAAAVASLQGKGGGLDPINAVRKVAGLDRLRILPADVSTGQHTSIAAGKYVTRKTYVELITDGQGYSATRIEFQVTRWLSLLSSISTLGRTSANVRISKDY